MRPRRRAPDVAAWEPFAAALVAPVVIWVLWRLQILSVEALRVSLVRMARAHKWLYNVVSWFGTLIHELSHASVLLLSGHGIREFSVKVERGFVTPSRMRRGPVSFLFFLVAALAPLFVPPVLVLLAMAWVDGHGLVAYVIPAQGLAPAAGALQAMVLQLPRDLVLRLAHLDLSRWQEAVILAAVLLGMPSARPSHVKGSKFHGEKDEGDIAVLRSRIRQNPWPLIVFLLVLYGGYFAAMATWPAGYWVPLETVWALAVTGIVLALVGSALWALMGMAARTYWILGWLGPAAFAATWIILHRLGWSSLHINGLGLAVWFVVALLSAVLVPKRR